MEESQLTAPTSEAPESIPLQLSLRSSDIDRFTKLFYDPEALSVGKKAGIQLHVLRIDSGEFALAELYESLADASITYALSRTNAAKYFADPRMSIANKVKEKFRLPELKSGEGGEVLLYTFLESHLVAPKLLSKLELKTANDDYVKGADGIHLRQSSAERSSFLASRRCIRTVKASRDLAFKPPLRTRSSPWRRFETASSAQTNGLLRTTY